MIERLEIHGVPATVVAEAHVTLPGDEQVDVPLKLVRNGHGSPVFEPDFDAVTRVLLDRRTLG